MSKKRVATAKISAPKRFPSTGDQPKPFPLTGDQLLPPMEQFVKRWIPDLQKKAPRLNEGSIYVFLTWDCAINQVLGEHAMPDGQMGGATMIRENIRQLVKQIDSTTAEKMEKEPECGHPHVLFAIAGETRYACSVCDLGVVGPS